MVKNPNWLEAYRPVGSLKDWPRTEENLRLLRKAPASGQNRT